MRRLLLALCVSLIASTAAAQQRVVGAPFGEAVIIAGIQKMLSCPSPGQWIHIIFSGTIKDKHLPAPLEVTYGTKCHEDGKIKAFVGGVINYNLIDRAKKAGLPVDTMRNWLTVPVNLEWLEKNPRVARLVVNAMIEPGQIEHIFDEKSVEKRSFLATRYIQGFIGRRMAEAKTHEDARRNAATWGRIIAMQEQFLREIRKVQIGIN